MVMKKTIGYLGPEGSYSHEVALHVGDSDNCKLISLEPSRFAQAMREKKVWKVVLPIVNAIGWQVQWVLDLLTESSDGYQITGEIIWNIRSYLVGFGHKDQIKMVYSHSQPLDQCRRFLEGMPDITTQALGSTSASVKLVADKKDPTIAAIGTQYAAGKYGVPIIASNISDFPDNQTRFVVLGGRRPPLNENNRTTLIFGVSDKPRALLEVLEVFGVLDINIGTILSTRSPNRKLGECLFIVDVDGHQRDEDLRVALSKIRERTYLKVLGSYHKATIAANAG